VKCGGITLARSGRDMGSVISLTHADELRRQLTTETDFTYSISGKVISIVDLDLGSRSVTNDIENVFA
jgi:hypothetical protein